MPLTNTAVDALGVLTICLVSLLLLLGSLCILYTLYFRSRIIRSGFVQLGYFNGPWIIRITFILFGILWGLGEILRLTFLRKSGRFLNTKWHENACKYYIVSNLGFAEPCLFLILSFLLRASLRWSGSHMFSHRWNGKTAGYVILYCLPFFVLELSVILLGTKITKMPRYFTSATSDSGLCAYPLLSAIIHGFFAMVLTTYLLLLGKQVVTSVINKGLQKRVYMLIFLVSSFLPLRVVLLGFSVMSKPGKLLFETLSFCAFLMLFSCVVVGVFMLVYLPVADSLALKRGFEGRSGPLVNGDDNDYTDSENQELTRTSSAAVFEEELRIFSNDVPSLY